MYVRLFLVFILCWCGSSASASLREKDVITYDLNGGRLGDNILNYSIAKYISLKTGLKFLYNPFEYSDFFKLSEQDPYIYRDGFCKRVDIITNDSIYKNDLHPVFYCASLYHTQLEDFFTTSTEQENILIKTLFSLSNTVTIPSHELSSEQINIAVHIRMGTGFDAPLTSTALYSGHDAFTIYEVLSEFNHLEHIELTRKDWFDGDAHRRRINIADIHFPHKFPPLQYYIDQIEKMVEYFPDQKIRIYLFTDHSDPAELVSVIRSKIDNPLIEYWFREEDNFHNANVVEDLRTIMHCDGLIRSGSNFSWAAHLLGNHKIVIFPRDLIWWHGCLVVNKIGIVIRSDEEVEAQHTAVRSYFLHVELVNALENFIEALKDLSRCTEDVGKYQETLIVNALENFIDALKDLSRCAEDVGKYQETLGADISEMEEELCINY